MIRIDGSQGEGGGQVLRTSVALSAVTGRPIRVFDIRAKRKNQGLMAQHIGAIEAVARLCGAEVKGIAIGSKEIEFTPSEISGGRFNIDIGTAGSITLVLQALMLPAMFAKKTTVFQIRGGTDVNWSPPIDYLSNVTMPLLGRFGYTGAVELLKRGYYPAGGGKVTAKITPCRMNEIVLKERGRVISVKGVSHAHASLGKGLVAERQMKAARTLLYNKTHKEIGIVRQYVRAQSYGSGLTLWAETENSRLGAGALGEKGKSAEIVGQEAAGRLIKEVDSGAALDVHMADQIVPYLALFGGGVSVSEVTEHTRTNVEVCRKFGFDVEIEGNIIKASKTRLFP